MEEKLVMSTDIMVSASPVNVWGDDGRYHFNVSNTFDTAGFNEEKSSRIKKLITQSEFDHYVLQIVLAGTLVGNFNGIDVFAEPGDIVILDSSRISATELETSTRITIFIPCYELEKRVGWRKLHGVILKAQAPTTGLLFNYVKGMANLNYEFNATEALAAKEALLLLLALSINDSRQNLADNASINLTMRHRILAHIDDNLTNPQLGPPSIQQHFHVSRSHLYRAFEPDGGVAKVIRERRLERAYRLIIDTKGKPLSLKEIAYQCGFQDTNQFSNAFKKRYGISPRNARTSGPASGHKLKLFERGW